MKGRVFGIVLLVVSASATGLAQRSGASLFGVVKINERVVPVGTLVTAVDVKTGRTWRTRTSSIGSYAFELLPKGRYRVTVAFTELRRAPGTGEPIEHAQRLSETVELIDQRGGFMSIMDFTLTTVAQEDDSNRR